jgi:predicted metalloprotease
VQQLTSRLRAASHLDEGSQAVGGAAGVGDDHIAVLVLVCVDTNHVGGDVAALGGGSDQHLLGTSLQERRRREVGGQKQQQRQVSCLLKKSLQERGDLFMTVVCLHFGNNSAYVVAGSGFVEVD